MINENKSIGISEVEKMQEIINKDNSMLRKILADQRKNDDEWLKK
jgi:hypothetical protein